MNTKKGAVSILALVALVTTSIMIGALGVNKYYDNQLVQDPYSGGVDAASGGSSLWKMVSSRLVPVNSNWGLKIPDLGSTGDPCLSVDATGVIATTTCGAGGGGTWGSITGTLSDQTDLQTALDGKISVGTTSIDSITTLANLGITESQITDLGSYLTSESDPIFVAHEAYNITTGSTTNWITAYGWGDHAGLYVDMGTTSVDSITTLSNLSITESQISDLDHYTDADISGSEAAFTGWDKTASDDFLLTTWYATTTHALISSLPSLSITESQISDLTHYVDADVAAYISGSSTIPNMSCSTGEIMEWGGSAWICTADETGGAPAWGSITGTLSAQTDLQNALDAKLSLSSWYATTTHANISSLPSLSITESQISDLGSYLTGVAWGDITGTLSAQTDLQNALNAKFSLSDWYATTTHSLISSLPSLSITESQISDLSHYTDADIDGNEAAFTGWDKDSSDDFLLSAWYATTSAPQLTTLANLSITESQISDLSHYADADVSVYISGSSTVPNMSCSTGEIMEWSGSAWVCAADETGGAPAWGSITGTLSNQTDLQTELDAKFSLSAWFATTTHALISSLPSLSITESQISDLTHYTDSDIDGNESAFTGWDKDASDDFLLSTWYATTTHALISSLPSLSITESQISDLTHYADADVSTYLVGGTGVTEAAGTISFDCSEVEGTGINCTGEAITLDATGDWTGTLDTFQGADFLTKALWYATTTDGLTQGSTNLYNQAHTGDVTGSTALTIATNAVEESMIDFNSAPTANYVPYWNSVAGKLDYTATTSWDTDTTYTAGGTLLDLTGTTFSLNEGTMTDTKLCTYEAGTGIVCNHTDATGGGGGSGAWATTTDSGVEMAYLVETASDLVVGSTATSTAELFFDVSDEALNIGNGGGGDSIFKLAVAGVTKWVMGLDDSDNDNFVISGGTALGTNNLLTINDTTDMVTVPNLTVSTAATLPNNTIIPSNVHTTGLTDEYCLTYEATGTTWEWQTCGGGSSLFTDGGDYTYLTATTDDLALGAAATTSAPFWWDVSATTTYIGNGGSGDSLLSFAKDAVKKWILGRDDTDGNFKIATSSDFSTGVTYEVDYETGAATSTGPTHVFTDGTNGLRIIPGATTTLDFF